MARWDRIRNATPLGVLCVGAVGLVPTAHLAPAAAQAVRADRIVFVSNRETKSMPAVFVMNPDGTGVQRLSRGTALEFDPVWSPDGKQVAFAAAPNPTRRQLDIYVMNADGSERRRVTQGETLAFSPSWSPDAKRLVFSTIETPVAGTPLGGMPAFRINVVDVDGANLKRIGEGLMPAWSPQGQTILYTAFDQAEQMEPTLYIMNADGTNAKPVAGRRTMMGSWSPDGRRIAYTGEGGGEQPDLFVVNLDGANRMRVRKSPDLEYAPQWSPDGKQLYFTRVTRKYPGKASVCVVDLNGKNFREITHVDGIDAIGSATFWSFGGASGE